MDSERRHRNPLLKRQMSFNGLAIYYSAYAQVDTDKTETGKLLDKGSKDLKELCKLIKAWKSTDESTEIGKDTV